MLYGMLDSLSAILTAFNAVGGTINVAGDPTLLGSSQKSNCNETNQTTFVKEAIYVSAVTLADTIGL